MGMNVVAGGEKGTVCLVGQFWEDLDLNQFQEHVAGLVEKGLKRIIVDLSRLTFINSRGLGTVAKVFSDAADCGVEIVLLRPRGTVKEAVKVSGFEEVMRVVESEEELDSTK